jgi:hypothetical protein
MFACFLHTNLRNEHTNQAQTLDITNIKVSETIFRSVSYHTKISYHYGIIIIFEKPGKINIGLMCCCCFEKRKKKKRKNVNTSRPIQIAMFTCQMLKAAALCCTAINQNI